MDDVFLLCRVPSSHCFSSCYGYALCHANKFLRCGGLGGWFLGLEKLREENKKNSVVI